MLIGLTRSGVRNRWTVILSAPVVIMVLCAPALGADLEMGKKTYLNTCQVCHGERGDGQTFVVNVLSPPPRNFTSEISRKELTHARMIRSVTNGRPGTAMMPWKSRLSAGEIRDVVAFIRKQFMGFRD